MLLTHKWSHNVIRTPSDTINLIGCGGIDQGTVCELAGPPGSGKSAFSYDTASNFLKDNPTGVVVVLDPECSVDLIRLEHTFRIDMDRLVIQNAKTLEEGFAEIFRIVKNQDEAAVSKITAENFLDNFTVEDAVKHMKAAGISFDLSLIDENLELDPKVINKARIDIAILLAFRGILKPKEAIPVFIIWDTIAASIPRKEVDAAMSGEDPINAGGMGLRARILTTNLMIVMSSLYGRNITLFLLNQIRMTGFGSYQGPKETSSGGHALKHTNHYYFWFSHGKKVYDEKLKMNIGSKSFLDVLKSKFGPTMKQIPIFINDQVGGKIVSEDEAVLVAVDIGLLYSTGPWWRIKGDPNNIAYRWEATEQSLATGKYIAGNPEIRELCIKAIANHFRKSYFTLDIVYKKLGITLGELSESDEEERNKLSKYAMSRPSFFKDEGEEVVDENGEVRERVKEEPKPSVMDKIMDI